MVLLVRQPLSFTAAGSRAATPRSAHGALVDKTFSFAVTGQDLSGGTLCRTSVRRAGPRAPTTRLRCAAEAASIQMQPDEESHARPQKRSEESAEVRCRFLAQPTPVSSLAKHSMQ